LTWLWAASPQIDSLHDHTRLEAFGHFRLWQILLQKSKVASVRVFGETSKRKPVDDSDNLSRATEVAYEFYLGR
jgi:hypothetical protein